MAVPLELGRHHQAADLDSLPPKQVPVGAKIADTNTELKAHWRYLLASPACVIAVTRHLKERRVYFDAQFEGTGHRSRKGMVAGVWGSWSHCFLGEEAGTDECWNAAHFLCLGSQPTESCCPHLGWVLPPQSSQPRKSLTDTKAWAVSPVFGDPAKLTISANRHTSHYPRSVRLLLAKVQLSKQHPPATGQWAWSFIPAHSGCYFSSVTLKTLGQCIWK